MKNDEETLASVNGYVPEAEKLKQALKETENSPARTALRQLFDEATFAELGAYTFGYRSDPEKTAVFDGVVCGYGSVCGKLTYAFAQEYARNEGAVDKVQADKILSVYRLALQNGAPVVGIFNSGGADLFDGISALSAYSRVMRAVTEASGKIPQIALIAGPCTGTAAVLASLFDFVIRQNGAPFYVHGPEFGGETEDNDCAFAFLVPSV
ncbi:MAG: hypothetical protein MJ078_02620 [Clostridia bacterium]|nr:hypothetical protein [Clostridia bacterium]